MLIRTMLHCLHFLIVCDSCGMGMRGAEFEPWSEPTTDVALYFHSLRASYGMPACFVVHLGLLDEAIRCVSRDREHAHSDFASHLDICAAAIVLCNMPRTNVAGQISTARCKTIVPRCPGPYMALGGFFRFSDTCVAVPKTENVRQHCGAYVL